MQHFLYEPKLFHNGVQLIVPIPTNEQKYAVEQYWSLDDTVVKEVIVKKLKNKSRKDLDEVTQIIFYIQLIHFLFTLAYLLAKIMNACGGSIGLKRVTRQFDNIRRLYLSIEEERKFECNLMDYISVYLDEANLGISRELIFRYSSLHHSLIHSLTHTLAQVCLYNVSIVFRDKFAKQKVLTTI